MSNNFEHIKWLLASSTLHIALLVFIFSSTKPIILQQQVLMVDLVSMSSVFVAAQDNPENTQEKESPKPKLLPKKDGQYEEKKEQKKISKKAAPSIQKQTSGQQSENATKENSAQTNPVFNAKYLNNPPPIYPQRARMRNIEGRVLLEVLVQINGLAKTVNILESSNSSLLDRAALNAIKQWKFIPAKRGDRFIEAKVLVPIEFKLN